MDVTAEQEYLKTEGLKSICFWKPGLVDGDIRLTPYALPLLLIGHYVTHEKLDVMLKNNEFCPQSRDWMLENQEMSARILENWRNKHIPELVSEPLKSILLNQGMDVFLFCFGTYRMACEYRKMFFAEDSHKMFPPLLKARKNLRDSIMNGDFDHYLFRKEGTNPHSVQIIGRGGGEQI